MAGHLVVHCIVAQDVPTNVGHLLTWWGLGPTRPTRRYATAEKSIKVAEIAC